MHRTFTSSLRTHITCARIALYRDMMCAIDWSLGLCLTCRSVRTRTTLENLRSRRTLSEESLDTLKPLPSLRLAAVVRQMCSRERMRNIAALILSHRDRSDSVGMHSEHRGSSIWIFAS